MMNAMHCECNAKSGHNVNGVLITCAELVLQCRDNQSGEGKINHEETENYADLRKHNDKIK